MDHPKALHYYQQFLLREWSVENLIFYVTITEYKRLPPEKLRPQAENIYNVYIKEGAVNELNISNKQRMTIKSELSSANTNEQLLNLFNDVMDNVYEHLARDSYIRFLRSDYYLTLQKELSLSARLSENNLL